MANTSSTTRFGVLHPGSMGISLAVSAQATGHDVCWASDGRSAATRARADEHGLTDLGSLEAICAECAAILSICPPAATEQVAADVAASGFTGLYIDERMRSAWQDYQLDKPVKLSLIHHLVQNINRLINWHHPVRLAK